MNEPERPFIFKETFDSLDEQTKSEIDESIMLSMYASTRKTQEEKENPCQERN